MTILLVTHDIDESVYIGDRVIVLTKGPGRVRAEVPVDLPAPRDQITTKELREFAHLRAEVSRLVRATRNPSPRCPTTPPEASRNRRGSGFSWDAHPLPAGAAGASLTTDDPGGQREIAWVGVAARHQVGRVTDL